MNNTDNKTQLFLGNNIELLRQLPDNSVDAIVTDPPYGLGEEPNPTEVLQSWITTGYHEIEGKGFMGKEWDAFVPQPLFWKEAYRVLKHGGHVLSFFGTRTYDWGVMAMRFAGFEVRDCIQWLYGSGFPKSHNISKAIDKMYGAEREVVGKSDYTMPKADNSMGENSYGISGGKLANGTTAERITADITAPATEDAKQWDGWGSALKPANEPIVLARKPLEKGLSIAENVLKHSTGGLNIDGCRIVYKNEDDKTSAVWGNQTGNINDYGVGVGNMGGKNILAHNTGRFPANLILTHHPDCECIGTKKVKAISGGVGENSMGGMGKNGIYGEYALNKLGTNAGGLGDENGQETIENWNCHPDCPVKLLDEQSGDRSSTRIGNENMGKKNSLMFGGTENKINERTSEYRDFGGASRFYYTAKASKEDRNEGLKGFEEKHGSNNHNSSGRDIGGKLFCEICKKRQGACACEEPKFSKQNPNTRQNIHPTVKPTELMRYLCRLITPPNGVVLDPFMGSGSTGKAAILEGFKFIGMELEEEYYKIAEARIAKAERDYLDSIAQLKLF